MQKGTIVEKEEERQVLVFNLLNNELGLDIFCVREILKPQEVHALPKAPGFIEGVINLRGHIIAVMDLRKKFNIKVTPALPAGREDKSKMRIIICKIKEFIIGLIVDSVSEVISLSKHNIEPTPKIVSMQIEDSYVSAIARLGERVIILLDLGKILTKEEAEKLSETGK